MTETKDDRRRIYNPRDLFMDFQDHKKSAAYRTNFLLYMALFAIVTQSLLIWVLETNFPNRQGLMVVFTFIAGGLLGFYIWRMNVMRFKSVGNGNSGIRLGGYLFATFTIYTFAIMGTWLNIPEIHKGWLIPIGIVAIMMLLEWLMARLFWIVYGLLILGFWVLRMEPSSGTTLMIIAWIVVLAAMMYFVPEKIWMIEIERGQIYFYRPYYASKQNIQLLNRPASELTPALREQLMKYVPEETIEQFIAYSAPKAAEKSIRAQVESNLHPAYLDYVIESWRKRGADPIADEVKQLDRTNQEQLINSYCPPEVQVEIRQEANVVLEQFFNLWDKSDIDPVAWINPRDSIGQFWGWGKPIFIQLPLDKVITRSESIVEIDLSFLVLPDPRIITDTQAFTNFAESADRTQLIEAVKNSFSSNANRKTREFFLTKSPFEISTLECLTEFRDYLANQALEGVEKSMGMMVLAPTIQYTLKISDAIETASIESHIERIQSDVWSQILKKAGASNDDIRNFIFTQGVLKHADKTGGINIDDIMPNRGYTTLKPTDEVTQPPKPNLPPPSGQQKFPSQMIPPPIPPTSRTQNIDDDDDDIVEGKFVDIDDYDD